MRHADPNVQKYRELSKQKRRILDKMKKYRKSLAKARVEKKNVNEEITRLRKSGFAFAGMTAVEAQAKVSGEIQAVEPGDIYPVDLERKFDKLERTTEVTYRKGSVDISDMGSGPAASRLSSHDDDGVRSVVLDSESGVVDFGEGEEDEISEPVPEEVDDAE